MSGWRSRWGAGLAALAAGVTTCALTATAAAHSRGIVVDSCAGCHGGNDPAPQVSLTAEPASFEPGELVTLTLAVRAASIRVGGVYLTTGGVGALQPLSGEGLVANGGGLTHNAPKAAKDGAVSFRFEWRAPTKPGAVDFGVAAVAGNGNNASSGDFPGGGSFQWVFGCMARTFYLDLDRDGYGAKGLGTKLGCEDGVVPVGFAAKDGDCDENDEKAHPGATEVCNKKDDDCDGQTDEGAEPVPLWPDGDGDGFYASATGTAKMGCGNVPGFAARGGDCDDLDASVNPGATEICNGKDDNCDREVDERVRPQCGKGWCARYSPSCDAADCKPGPPLAETCNTFDDDCDGEIDNDACADGLVCSSNQCVASAPTGGSESTAGSSGGMDVGGSGSGAASGVDAAGAGARKPDASPSPAAEAGCSLRSQRPAGAERWSLIVLLGSVLAFRRRRR